jgi:Rad3-related DNA helicase
MSSIRNRCTRIINDLGLEPKEVEYIEIKPPFPAENHKIFNLRIANFHHLESETPTQAEQFFKEVVERIDMILELFPDERGIIHCVSYEIAKKIKRYSAYRDRLIFHDTKDREEKLEEHKNTERAVLVSPSMTEGIDLKDDLSRFQVLVKVPFPDSEDERIRQRKIIDPPSYPYRTAVSIIQAVGRSVRSEKDHAVTFTLDNRFPVFSREYQNLMKPFTRCVVRNSELLNLPGTQNKGPDFITRLLKPIPRITQVLT